MSLSDEPKNEKKGLVFNIQRFSIHDGPGIRTTVFMKGCPLNCLWCSNPESQRFTPDLIVRDINCKGCGACVEVCPLGAVTLTAKKGRKIDWERCDQCLLCVDACIYGSLNACGAHMDVDEVLDEVLRDDAFYRNSGGGITVSGGEALSQPDFVRRLLKISRQKGLHTTLDTTGSVAWEDMERVLPYVDLILWDIKHLDTHVHKQATGVGNELILENIDRAAGLGKRIWLRMPLIAGFNDDPEHIAEITALAIKVGAEKISLLPYHEGGVSKSEQLGRPYPFPQGKTPSDEHIAYLKEIIEGEGIKVSVGS
ncbi:MAG: glycyl-radical enzyme activating protein [Deltaproteobacteria bacterium]|nr:glycyl-radical enzyme activating protein [Deltaproteobacteria bacterium]